MRRHSQARVGRQLREARAGGIKEAEEALDVGAESALALGQGRHPGAPVGIEHRQVREADAGRRGGREDAVRQLGRVGIGRAPRLVMNVIELGHGGEARLLHLHEGQRRHRLHLLGRQAVGEAIHEVAPSPEAVPPRGPCLGHARHGALEGVAVEVRRRRQQRVHGYVAGTRPLARRER